MATILVADDDLDIRNLIAAELSDFGHEVVQAEDGETALALAFSRAPMLLIVDLNMPRMSGLDVLEALRDAGHQMPIILYSAVESFEAKNFIRLGFSRVVQKPCSIDAILEAINACLA